MSTRMSPRKFPRMSTRTQEISILFVPHGTATSLDRLPFHNLRLTYFGDLPIWGCLKKKRSINSVNFLIID